MILLGIMYSTNSTAALMVDGKIVACASEDRFSRQKSIHAYPMEAIDFCLKFAGIKPSQIDLIALPYIDINNFDKFIVNYDGTFSVQDKIEEQYKYFKPLLLEKKNPDFLEIFKNKIIPERLEYLNEDNEKSPIHTYIRKHLNVGREKIKYFHHHLSHVYYGVYSQKNFKDPSLILTMEGFGGDRNASVAAYKDGNIETIYKTGRCHIGRLYRYVTLLLGMKSNEHEYKVMGLAPYASEYIIRKPLEILKQTMYVDGIELKYKYKPSDLYFYFRDRFEGIRFDAVAGALQKYTEDIMTQWTANAISKTGIRNVIWSGGVAMNIKAMMEVTKIPQLQNLWVGATSSDESIAMGVLFQAFHQLTGKDPELLSSIYLGNEYKQQEIDNFLKNLPLENRYKIIRNISADKLAELLVDNKIIGRFCGRMEFGARSLGNRSILANPKSPHMIRRINEKIKNRDFWMPFAPVILKERQKDYLLNSKTIESPYMTIGFETTPRARKELPAALHPYDFTARPQILSKEDNPPYYAIIKAFEKKTGIGALLNTSFNVHGEPIVCTIEDAWDVFTRSGLEGLVLENTFIEKG